MIRFLALMLAVAASPAAAAGWELSLRNTDFVVLLGFLVFVGILLWFKIPALIGRLLDKRAATIRADLQEARKLREEAQELRASFERKKGEVKEQAERIVAKAKADAEFAAKQAKADLETAIARRLRTAEDKIASAEAAAVKAVRDEAIAVSISAASELIAKNLSSAEAKRLIDESITTV
ncbi:MAG: ATP F0F1 synthase subunit B, partial [Pararhodobacter sp.]